MITRIKVKRVFMLYTEIQKTDAGMWKVRMIEPEFKKRMFEEN